jgi:hypothetical protein
LAKDHMETHLLGDTDVRDKGKDAIHTAPLLCHGRGHQCDRDLIHVLAPRLDEVVVAPRARGSAGGGALVTAATDTAVAATGVGVQ